VKAASSRRTPNGLSFVAVGILRQAIARVSNPRHVGPSDDAVGDKILLIAKPESIMQTFREPTKARRAVEKEMRGTIKGGTWQGEKREVDGKARSFTGCIPSTLSMQFARFLIPEGGQYE
jgi:hypothetical protein